VSGNPQRLNRSSTHVVQGRSSPNKVVPGGRESRSEGERHRVAVASRRPDRRPIASIRQGVTSWGCRATSAARVPLGRLHAWAVAGALSHGEGSRWPRNSASVQAHDSARWTMPLIAHISGRHETMRLSTGAVDKGVNLWTRVLEACGPRFTRGTTERDSCRTVVLRTRDPGRTSRSGEQRTWPSTSQRTRFGAAQHARVSSNTRSSALGSTWNIGPHRSCRGAKTRTIVRRNRGPRINQRRAE
jgi:hypothetical protein